MTITYGDPQQDWLTPAIKSGTSILNTMSNWKRNDAMNTASLAAAAASKAGADLDVSQLGAQQGMPGSMSALYRIKNNLLKPGEDPASLYGSAMSSLGIGMGGNVENLAGAADSFSRGIERQGAIDMYPENPSQAAFQGNVANDLAAPDVNKVTGDYAYNPMDPMGGVRVLPGATKANKPVPVTINGKPTMAVWDGAQYTPIEGATPPATGSVDPRGKLKAGMRWTDRGGAEPIPGSDAKSPEQSAKITMLSQGMADLQKAKDLIYNPDGSINNRTLIEMQGADLLGMSGVPRTDSRLLYSYIYNAIEGKLRAESGAAVPDSEVTRMAKRFVPSALDNEATVKSKLDRLEGFMQQSLEVTFPAGVPSNVSGTAPVQLPEGDAGKEVYDSLPSGTPYTWGTRNGVKP